jgi:low affinity Fe/Cu permease
MLVSITFFGVVTANLPAYFVQNDREHQPLQEKLDEVLVRLSRLEEALEQVFGEAPGRVRLKRNEVQDAHPTLRGTMILWCLLPRSGSAR